MMGKINAQKYNGSECMIINNYTLIEEKPIIELNAKGTLWVHNKSGAKVFVISNDDENKTFSIAFRTPPKDNTGLPHILEHSVLCGSRKFDIKDPFVELSKGSLNTFLNAMTFSDKTMYPVASCNDKDFENLMDVYLDAVFYPNIYREDKILKQEGWHYELLDENSELTYRGVVYNEMKGVFSSPEQIVFRKIQQILYPDTVYANESGGDPDFITDLTQEDFLDFHKKYYHPSNSYIFLYGNMDVTQKLEWLDKMYLKDFDKIEIDSRIKKQAPFSSTREVIDCYPISGNESTKENTYLSLSFCTGESTNKKEYIGLEVLEYILLEAPGAPLKKALIDANIGKDVFSSFDNSILQPSFSIIVKNSDIDKKDLFLKTVHDTLTGLVRNGIGRKRIQAAINYYEFKTKEADYGRYPKGVMYAMRAMDSWLYDESPFMHFEYNETFEELKKGMDDGYFESLIEKYLLNNTHSAVLILQPDSELLSKKEEELRQKLQRYKESLTEEEINKLIKDTKNLEDFQNAQDSKEAVESIPLLELSDIRKEVEHLDIEQDNVQNVMLLRHTTFTNNILYLQFNFDTKKVPLYLIPYLGLLTNVLGKMDTTNYEYSDLASEINIHTGGIKYNMNVYGVYNDWDVFRPKFEITGKCFVENIPKLFELVKEIIFETNFSDTKRLNEIVLEAKSRMQMHLNSNGHIAAFGRAESYFSQTGYYRDCVTGIEYLKFLQKIEEDYDSVSSELEKNFKLLAHILFRPENLVVGMTGELSALNSVKHELSQFVDSLDVSEVSYDDIKLQLNHKNEGIKTSGKIQYVAKAGNFLKCGHKFSGSLRVLQTILSLDYLWQNVRIKGGAYGCMTGFKRDGCCYFVSYRDPNLKETLNVFEHVVDYVSTFNVDEREMRKYIIGTISKLDQPLTPSMKNDKMLAQYFGNISEVALQQERDEVLATTPEKIRELSNLIKDTFKENYICVLGNENKIEQEKDLFKDIIYLV